MYDPCEEIQDNYGLSDFDMMQLLGCDSETQLAMISNRPELRQVVREVAAVFDSQFTEGEL